MINLVTARYIAVIYNIIIFNEKYKTHVQPK